jgi:hypothetical protein
MQTPEFQHELTNLYREEEKVVDFIKSLSQQPIPDDISLHRLRRRHQFLKNEICKLRNEVLSDIIA